MAKNLMKLDNEQIDDDFEKMFQEYLDDEQTSDDPDTDDDDTTDGEANDDDIISRLGGQRSYMPDIKKVDIEIQPQLFGDLYINGDVEVTIRGKRGSSFGDDRFQLNILGEGYYPMANTRFYSEKAHPSPTSVAITMMSRQIWLPGKYVLFIRDTIDGSLIRMPFILDKQLKAKVGYPESCPICSADDILTTMIDGSLFDWDLLAEKPGMVQIRRFIVESLRLVVYNEFRQGMNGEPLTSKGHLLIATRNRDLAHSEIFELHKLVAKDFFLRTIDCSMLFDAARNNPYEVLFEELSGTGRQIFCLTNLGALLSTGGKIIVKKVIDKIRSDEKQFVLWLCGYKQDIEALLNMYPSLRTFFPADRRLEQETYRDFELVQAFFAELKEQKLYCSIDAMDALARGILEGWQRGTLSTWTVSDIRRFAQEQIKPRYLERCFREIESERLPYVEIPDLCLEQITSTCSTYEQCLKELDEMVGLDEVKQGIREMADNTSFFAERRRRGLATSQKAAFHCIFTGNPGTGKTTVAKQLGMIYRSLGLLSKGEVIAVDRTRLVGRYIGETEENMKAILEEARGNVLFIDEAYTLYDGASDRKDFGARVIDSLLTVLSQPDPDMLIIFAGYLKEMDAMLNTNPGLKGRFPYKYQFKDYNVEQLYEIACRLLKRDEYVLSPESEALLRESIAKAYAQRDENFSNARWVEQFVNNGIIPAMASRLSRSTSDDYQTIEASDIRQAYARFNPQTISLKPRRKVGFSA